MSAIAQQVDAIFRAESARLVAPLIRISGSFALAEEILQDAFIEALERWERDGIPDEPVAWLRRVAQNRAIDKYRRSGRWKLREQELTAMHSEALEDLYDPDDVRDDMLRLIFTCCHPSLSTEAQLALTLKTVCGLTTEQVARALLLKPTTLGQRVVRAKRKIEDARIPYVVPSGGELRPRLSAVLKTVYLVFNEGYGASDGDSLIRRELSDEAVRLARLLVSLLPEELESTAVLALMLLHDSRRNARVDRAGGLIPLDEQNRSLWDRAQIDEALPMVDRALGQNPVSPYAIEAAIAALHARATRPEKTDWKQIAALYGVLEARTGGSPVVTLNRAVAVALAGDVEHGLAMLNALEESGALGDYHLLHVAQADLLRRLGRLAESQSSYERARGLTQNGSEQRFLDGKISALKKSRAAVESQSGRSSER
ncbi:MAG: RNA polymerase sigma factor [Myxococcota bacterium]